MRGKGDVEEREVRISPPNRLRNMRLGRCLVNGKRRGMAGDSMFTIPEPLQWSLQSAPHSQTKFCTANGAIKSAETELSDQLLVRWASQI